MSPSAVPAQEETFMNKVNGFFGTTSPRSADIMPYISSGIFMKFQRALPDSDHSDDNSYPWKCNNSRHETS